MCPEPSAPISGSLGSYSSTTVGTVVMVKCEPGYYPHVISLSTTCSSSDMWSPDPTNISCVLPTCNTISTPTCYNHTDPTIPLMKSMKLFLHNKIFWHYVDNTIEIIISECMFHNPEYVYTNTLNVLFHDRFSQSISCHHHYSSECGMLSHILPCWSSCWLRWTLLCYEVLQIQFCVNGTHYSFYTSLSPSTIYLWWHSASTQGYYTEPKSGLWTHQNIMKNSN